MLTRCQEIERTIIKNYRKELWSKFVKAIDEYQLVKENDVIGVCISGGKDSMLMAKLFQELKRHSDYKFDVKFIVMNPGYNDANLDLIRKNLATLEIPAQIVKTDIFEIANNQTENPCYLCARMRRGYLYTIAESLGCNKIAVGHHYDDVIETTLMNMLNSGSFQTMLPKLHSTNHIGMELIRPLYLIRENDIIKWASKNELKFIQCACKFTERVHNNNDELKSQRLETKKLIQELISYNPLVEKNIFKCACNINMDMILGYKKDGISHSFLETYETKGEKNE